MQRTFFIRFLGSASYNNYMSSYFGGRGRGIAVGVGGGGEEDGSLGGPSFNHRSYSSGGSGSRGRGRPPPHLKGREIGLWYGRQRQQHQQQGVRVKEEDIKQEAMDVDVDPQVAVKEELTSRGGGGGASRDECEEKYNVARTGTNRAPAHLRGRDIGLWYARQMSVHAKEEEIKGAMNIDVDPKLAEGLKSLISAFDEELSSQQGTGGPSSSCSFSDLLDDINSSTALPVDQVCSAVIRDTCKDQVMREDLNQLINSPKYESMMRFRQRLPTFKCKDDILSSISANPVVVISGETGCGKTTQIGQYILDDMILNGNGSICNILCTQPRRISAVSVAERVAEERCERIGNKSVGYVIRLESRKPKRDEGTITFCTTGVVFKYLKDDPYLKKYSHIIVDEVHERDTNSDILIAVLKDLVKVRSDLKVILMSATINADHFSDYFDKCPMFKIPGLTFPVQEFYLEDIIQQLNYKFPLNDDAYGPSSNRNYRREVYFDTKEYNVYLQNYVKRCYGIGHKYSRSTINEILRPESENFDSLVQLTDMLLMKIAELDSNNGAILIFLTGWDEISKLTNHLQQSGRYPDSKYILLPLHSMMPTVNQRQIFDRAPSGKRKIIIATNIAETSITIDDVVHVIDFGKIKMTNFDKVRNVESLNSEWESKANAKQRKGRAGRIQEGYCYHLFTKSRESTFLDYQKPEILRKRLEEVILQLKLLKLGSIRTLFRKLLDPPDRVTVDLSYDRLVLLHALNDEEKLTTLGYHLAHLPMHPQTGKMILLGAVFSVVDPVFSIAASLSFKDPFVMPLGKEHLVDRIRKSFAGSSKSDHWAIAEALKGYEKSGSGNDYCFRNFLSASTCRMLVQFKQQFCEQLYSMKFLTTTNPQDPSCNLNSSNLALVKAVVCAGLYPNVAKTKVRQGRMEQGGGQQGRRGPPFPVLKTKEDGNVYIHKKSVNAEEVNFECPFVVYHMKQKLKTIMLFDTTMISPFPLLFFAGGSKLQHKVDKGVSFVEIDGAYRFQISKAGFETIEALRGTLEKILGEKIAYPSPTDWTCSSLEGKLLIAIRDLITSQYIQIMNPNNESHDSDD